MDSSEEVKWDIIVEPKKGWFDIDFIEIWKYRDLLWLLVKRDFISFYKQTVLGPLWFFGQPLVTMIVYVFLFGRVAKLPSDGVPLPLFYIVGITSWSFFADCLRKTSTVLLDNVSVFGKVYFPRLIVPLSGIISSLWKYFFQLLLLVLIIIYFSLNGMPISPSFYLLLYPFLLVLLGLQGLGFGLIISSITIKYRDFSYFVGFGLQLMMFATTVVYPLSTLTGLSRKIVSLHPTTYLLEGIRKGIFGIGTFEMTNFYAVTLFTFMVLFIGIILFNRVEKNFVDSI